MQYYIRPDLVWVLNGTAAPRISGARPLGVPLRCNGRDWLLPAHEDKIGTACIILTKARS